MRRLAIVLLVGVCAGPALAQQAKPSFDCAKASTGIEKLICGSPELSKADANLAATYGALAAKLDAKAKDHLARDEAGWIGRRSRECKGAAAMMYDCVRDGYIERIGRLKLDGEGPYPFVSTRTLARKGRVGLITYDVVASYPQFDGTSADFAAVNKHFADDATNGAANAVPDKDAGIEREQEWSYEQDFTLGRPAPRAISVRLSYYSFSGGAHPNGAAWATLVDLKSGKAVGPDGVFAKGWLDRIVELAHADLERQFRERPGFDDALKPANLTKLLRDANRYSFAKDGLTLIFNRDDIGPYVVGPYDVQIPMYRIKELLRADGPLGELR